MPHYYPRTSTVRRMAGEHAEARGIARLTLSPSVAALLDPAKRQAAKERAKLDLMATVLSVWPTTHPRCVS